MRKIALIAVAFALIGSAASAHMASALSIKADNSTQNSQTVAQTETVPAPEPAPLPPQPESVTVQPGDTLSGIAETKSTTYIRLYNANDFIVDPDLIHPGEEIRVPNESEHIADREVPAPAPVQATEPVAEQTEAVASAPAPVVESAPAPEPAPAPAPAPVETISASDAEAKAYIYAHESSNNPNATNEIGCYGLGQDCNGQVKDLCGADYACQDEFFTNYAMNRYGSWANALAFWQSHHWW